MCGILGIVNVENHHHVDPDLLTVMSETMSHRGPDGSGVWMQKDGQCGLAHRRLSIVDLSPAGRQPMPDHEKQVWVSFNGEIYNYPEYRKFFENKGYIFHSQSDTEIILHLYNYYGESFIEHLDGDFGLGLWDCKEQKLILARDRAGVKPLYYTHFDGRFIFASEIKAILKYPGISKAVDPTAFYNYLTYLVSPPPDTLIKGIKKLEAASSLVLRPGQGFAVKVSKYWEPFPNVDYDTPFEQFDEELEALYTASVRKRLMSDVPVGVLFSGGVDSSLNAAAFHQLISPEKVKTFTVGMDNAGEFHDDSLIARRMALHLDTDHHEIRINETDLLTAMDKLASLQDEPVSDPVSIPLYFVTGLARENGVTVLQAGEGADELFCGYNNYRRFLRHHKKLWHPLSRLPQGVGSLGARLLGMNNSPKIRKIRDVLARRGKGQEFFMSSAIAFYELEKSEILSPEYRQSLGAEDSFNVVATYYERLQKICPDASLLQTITFIELQLRLPELLLMRADKMSMANSIELRVPFLDRDLMDFSMRVPDEYKLRDGISKEPIKRVASKFVPREEIYRPKTGFGVPIQEWFRGKLGTRLIDMMKDESSLIIDYINISRLTARIIQGPRSVNEAFQLWMIYNVLAWEKSL